MKNQQVTKTKETLSVLIGQPTNFLYRSLDMVCIEFGNIIEKRSISRDDTGKAVLGQREAGTYSLHAQSMYRMSCGDIIVFAKGDLYEPSAQALVHLDLQDNETLPDDFDYTQSGNNRLDEILDEKLASLKGFIVEGIAVNHLGDLHIKFSNGFEFRVLIDVSGPEECWRFFKSGDDEHLVVTGEGLEIDNQE